jgi:transcriptional/translational regulatory protein YebC/TACO1
MSGHSKWATTKHKKAIIDSRRAKLFAKLIKNIEVAARIGGPDIEGNPTLYDAIQKGRKSSLPKDNIESAVKRGAGLDGSAVDYQTIMYEGYGPNGVALLIECLTDNKNRGSVSYQFSRKGVIVVEKTENTNEDSVLEAVLEVGVEDVQDRGYQLVITTDPSKMVSVREALQSAGIDYESADVEFISSMPVQTDLETAKTVIALIDALEDSDEVQNVYSNFDMSAEVAAALDAE